MRKNRLFDLLYMNFSARLFKRSFISSNLKSRALRVAFVVLCVICLYQKCRPGRVSSKSIYAGNIVVGPNLEQYSSPSSHDSYITQEIYLKFITLSFFYSQKYIPRLTRLKTKEIRKLGFYQSEICKHFTLTYFNKLCLF